MNHYIIKGNFIFAKSPDQLTIYEKQFIVILDGKIHGFFKTIPDEFSTLPLTDYGDSLIIPGLVDMHTHAPQSAMRGVGMNLPLLDWLNKFAFPTEEKFSDPLFAKKVYEKYADDLIRNGTTKACIFATIHKQSTELLMDILHQKGITAYVGKVNMDSHAPDYLKEHTQDSLKETEEWIIDTKDKHPYIYPMITPRFAVSCSKELLEGLGNLAKKYDLAIQSHLCENKKEIETVKELFPEIETYTQVYEHFGLLNEKTVMAHCVHMKPVEIDTIKHTGAYIAHCPDSNVNLSSGIAPMRHFRQNDLKLGLGSDISAGTKICILDAMAQAIAVSKLRSTLEDQSEPLTLSEAFYLGTNTLFFHIPTGFIEGNLFDAVVIDDSNLPNSLSLSLDNRLERILYSNDARNILCVYANGKQIFENQ